MEMKSYNVIFFLDSVSHRRDVPTMQMTDLSILCKWKNVKNHQCIKYLFAHCMFLKYIHACGVFIYT